MGLGVKRFRRRCLKFVIQVWKWSAKKKSFGSTTVTQGGLWIFVFVSPTKISKDGSDFLNFFKGTIANNCFCLEGEN